MKNNLKLRRLLTIIAIVIICVLVFIIRFPYTIKAPCQIVGQKEWALIQVEPDKMLSKIYDNSKDRATDFTLLQFAREDFVQFRQNNMDDNWVHKDEAIATITSLNNQISKATLKGDLEKARDNLAIASVGEKQALLDEAERALELAKIQFNAYEPQYLRNKELFEKNLISTAEWEITKSTYEGFLSNISLHQARLDVVKTGEKEEVVEYMRESVQQLETQSDLMDTKIALGDIRAPFDGLISYPTQDSIICLVEKVDSMLCKLPIPAPERNYLRPGQEIIITLFESEEDFQAELLYIGQRSIIMNSTPSYILTGYIPSDDVDVAPGMSGTAEVLCENITLFEHLLRSFKIYRMQI